MRLGSKAFLICWFATFKCISDVIEMELGEKSENTQGCRENLGEKRSETAGLGLVKILPGSVGSCVLAVVTHQSTSEAPFLNFG